MEPWGTLEVTWDLENRIHLWLLVEYGLVDNYGANIKEEEEGRAKMSRVGVCERQNQMLLWDRRDCTDYFLSSNEERQELTIDNVFSRSLGFPCNSTRDPHILLEYSLEKAFLVRATCHDTTILTKQEAICRFSAPFLTTIVPCK